MDTLIKKINDLQDICTKYDLKKLQLPQIVVLGGQSTGKSSVLESIVGLDFLPRGNGIVTRRPLIIQLIHSDTFKAIFNHTNTEYKDLEYIKNELISETSRILKNKNDVSNIPITLKIFSPKVPTLTLIDLPGLVRVPTNNQPRDIANKIYEMCKEYAKNPNSLILAISAANNDIANSDALQLARDVDPGYERTIGVLTKIDTLEPGADVVDVLAGKVIKMKLGFVPVVNRGHTDNITIEEAQIREMQFFSNHKSYVKNIKFCGTQYLVYRMHLLLLQHIKNCLPDLQSSISSQLNSTKAELKSLGYPEDPKDCVLKNINGFCNNFSEQLAGSGAIDTTEIKGGARINYALHVQFPSYLDTLDPLAGMNDLQIKTVLLNCNGASGSNMFAFSLIDRLIQISLSALRPHVLKLVDICSEEVVRILEESIITRHPNLSKRILEISNNLIKENCRETEKILEVLVNWNINYIVLNSHEGLRREDLFKDLTGHKEKLDFYKINEKHTILDLLPKILRIKDSTESKDVMAAKSMVHSYFQLTKKIIVDQVPKAIMSEMVFKTKNMLNECLLKEIYSCDDVENLVIESDEIKERRAFLVSKEIALEEAYKVITSYK